MRPPRNARFARVSPQGAKKHSGRPVVLLERPQMKLLCLLLAFSGAALAEETFPDCQKGVDGKYSEACLLAKGKRIDDGESLGARSTPRNAEQQLTSETFSLLDAIQAAANTTGTAASSGALGGDGKAPLAASDTQLAPSSFVSGGSALIAGLKQRLDELVAKFKGKQNLRLEVVGHTDSQGLSAAARAKYGDNQGLGLVRARSVAEHLVQSLGLSAEGASASSQGATQPLASNDTAEGRAQNRRVEITAFYEDGEPRQEKVVLAMSGEGEATAPLRSCDEVLTARNRAAAAPFRISVDGVPTDDTGVIDPDIQRCTDVALEKADIQIRYDGFEQAPVLNAHAWPNAVQRDGKVEITPWSNYAAYITKAEIRIFAKGYSQQSTPLAVLPATLGQPVMWSPAGVKDPYVHYVLRVYDGKGVFDETRPKTLEITEKSKPTDDVEPRERELLAGYGENSLAFHNILTFGGAVTANGRGIKPGETVTFLGQPVPVDAKGAFAARQILPNGTHVVDVAVKQADGSTARYERNLAIARDDWFFVGIADITAGRNATTGPAKLVTADTTEHFDNKVYVDGRTAFYLKGKVKGEWLMTAGADTEEQPLKSLFSHFSEKDPRYLLRSLDPNKYYPVYGDDSTAIDDASTQGKFFVRLERGESQVMWGSFKTTFTGTDLANYNRTLYGARAKLVSDSVTKYGEKRGNVEVFVADPGTLQSREEFRGTGGSLYYLRHVDVSPGTERVWVEVRDKDTGLVLKTQPLVAAQDYEFNAIQGRVILREALTSTADAGSLVQTGSLNGHPVHLVVTYEYAPGITAVDQALAGGRASVWVNDHLQVGATGYQQDGPYQRLSGVDATLRYKPGTYVKVEGAHSNGGGSDAFTSLDGGFSFNRVTGGGGKAEAGRAEAAVDFAEIKEGAKGRATAYWQDRQAGFSGPGVVGLNGEATILRGGSVTWQATDATEISVKADEKDATSQTTKSVEANLSHEINPNWKASVGVRNDDIVTRTANASAILSQTGQRTDGVARIDYKPDAKAWSLYGYGQGTMETAGLMPTNDRFGAGGDWRVNDRFKLNGEVSDGDGGFGGRIGGDWQVDDRSSLYSNYTLTTNRTDDGFRGRAGVLTTGGKTRYSDTVSLNSESRYQHGDGPSGTVHAFGLDLSPNDRWTHGVKVEVGTLSDPRVGDVDRQALGLTTGYRKDDIRYAGALEWREDETNATGSNQLSRNTWLMKNTLGYQVNPDWRFLGRLNFSTSEASNGDFQDGEYLEVVTGYAWRPVKNDRWNTLFKYTYFYNMPSPGQVDGVGTTLDYTQRSHVFAVDTIYDIRPWLSIGGKLGARRGEMKEKVGGTWSSSDAWLGILRADWHWVHEWDILTELRMLDVASARDTRSGALVGVYKHLGKHVKFGVGYNFTDFSDDMTNLSYHSQGWFINLIGKM